MSVVLQTGVMHYRENEQDQWRPLIIKAQSIDFEALVDPYEPTVPKTWMQGEYCLQDDKIWRCVNSVTTPAEFDEDDWVQTTFGYEIEQLGVAVQDSEPNFSKVWIDTDETTSVTCPDMSEFNALETETETVENGLAIIVEGNSCVSGASQGQYVYLKNSTITGYTDGLYTAAQAIPANTAIDGTYLTAVTGGGLNSLKNTLNNVENGLAIIVNGDTCSMAVPVGGYAYIKNNTHSLAEGLYTNTSASVFPTSGGTADSTVFTAVSVGGLNSLKNSIEDLSAYVANGFRGDGTRFHFFRYGNNNSGHVYVFHLVGMNGADETIDRHGTLAYFDAQYAPDFDIYTIIRTGDGGSAVGHCPATVKTANNRGEVSIWDTLPKYRWVWGTLVWMK